MGAAAGAGSFWEAPQDVSGTAVGPDSIDLAAGVGEAHLGFVAGDGQGRRRVLVSTFAQ